MAERTPESPEGLLSEKDARTVRFHRTFNPSDPKCRPLFRKNHAEKYVSDIFFDAGQVVILGDVDDPQAELHKLTVQKDEKDVLCVEWEGKLTPLVELKDRLWIVTDRSARDLYFRHAQDRADDERRRESFATGFGSAALTAAGLKNNVDRAKYPIYASLDRLVHHVHIDRDHKSIEVVLESNHSTTNASAEELMRYLESQLSLKRGDSYHYALVDEASRSAGLEVVLEMLITYFRGKSSHQDPLLNFRQKLNTEKTTPGARISLVIELLNHGNPASPNSKHSVFLRIELY